MPAYWLGAFFNPRGLLALLKQEAIKAYCGDRSGNFEQFVFQTDTTFRDFGHVSMNIRPIENELNSKPQHSKTYFIKGKQHKTNKDDMKDEL